MGGREIEMEKLESLLHRCERDANKRCGIVGESRGGWERRGGEEKYQGRGGRNGVAHETSRTASHLNSARSSASSIALILSTSCLAAKLILVLAMSSISLSFCLT